MPDKVDDIVSVLPDGYAWGECVPAGDEYLTFSYLTTYPELSVFEQFPNSVVSFVYPEDMCNDKNKNYIEYTQDSLEGMGVPTWCSYFGGGVYGYYDVSTCAESHNIMIMMFYTSDCSGPPFMTAPALSACETPYLSDDDNSLYTDTLEAQYCT